MFKSLSTSLIVRGVLALVVVLVAGIELRRAGKDQPGETRSARHWGFGRMHAA